MSSLSIVYEGRLPLFYSVTTARGYIFFFLMLEGLKHLLSDVEILLKRIKSYFSWTLGESTSIKMH